jgi:hypothetical protein
MADLVASGRIVDFILVLVALEATGLALLKSRFGIGPGLGPVWANLAAGAALLFALRMALTNSGTQAISLALLLAFAAHLVDLWSRWR